MQKTLLTTYPISPSSCVQARTRAAKVNFMTRHATNKSHIHENSRHPVVELVRSVNTNAVIPVLETMISIFSIPIVLKPTKARRLMVNNFFKFAVHLDFHHWKMKHVWQQENVTAEHLTCTRRQVIRVGETQGHLMETRDLTHCPMSNAPCRTPQKQRWCVSARYTPKSTDHVITECDKAAKLKMNSNSGSFDEQ